MEVILIATVTKPMEIPQKKEAAQIKMMNQNQKVNWVAFPTILLIR